MVAEVQCPYVAAPNPSTVPISNLGDFGSVSTRAHPVFTNVKLNALAAVRKSVYEPESNRFSERLLAQVAEENCI